MAWYVSNDEERFRLGRRRTLGRDDFLDAPSFSKAHLAFRAEGGRLRVRDLGSRNGTWLRGERLLPHTDYPLIAGDQLRVGEVELSVDWRPPRATLAGGAAALVILSKIVDPSAALGRALGTAGLVTVVASALLAASLATSVITWLIPGRRLILRAVATVLLAVGLDAAGLAWLSTKTRLAVGVAHAKVDYHCLRHFDGRRCVRGIEACPACASTIDKWKRTLISRRLAAAAAGQTPPER